MSREERMYKSYIARKKRKQTKEVVETVEKRARADAKHLKKKVQKLKRRHHDGK
tara:strand:- start:3008 stop:3169 length:162 start_codon:yes stop_codon:yes gene_type:complete